MTKNNLSIYTLIYTTEAHLHKRYSYAKPNHKHVPILVYTPLLYHCMQTLHF